MTPRSWEHRIARYESRGGAVVAPPGAIGLVSFEPEEVELLAQTAAADQHRGPTRQGTGEDEIEARCAEDAQDAEPFRVLAYAGLRPRRRGGAAVGRPSSWQIRHVPLADPAHDVLARLGGRRDVVGREDHVFHDRQGGRPDISAIRCRGARSFEGRRGVTSRAGREQ